MENVSFDDFKKLDLRIAKIMDVKEHPNADKLYVIQIEVGGEMKQIVAGIRHEYDAGALIGRKIVVVNNLEPVVIRGEESNGMLLAARDGDSPVILVPEKDVPPGSAIS
jgi:methionyl-tRNA synthetase